MKDYIVTYNVERTYPRCGAPRLRVAEGFGEPAGWRAKHFTDPAEALLFARTLPVRARRPSWGKTVSDLEWACRDADADEKGNEK